MTIATQILPLSTTPLQTSIGGSNGGCVSMSEPSGSSETRGTLKAPSDLDDTDGNVTTMMSSGLMDTTPRDTHTTWSLDFRDMTRFVQWVSRSRSKGKAKTRESTSTTSTSLSTSALTLAS